MKKCIVICLLILSMLLCSCSTTVLTQDEVDKNETSGVSMFVIVESTGSWKVVYHRDTKVMYVVSVGGYSGSFTLLVNPDGSPMLFED